MAMFRRCRVCSPASVVAADSFNRLSDGAKVAMRPSASAAKPAIANK